MFCCQAVSAEMFKKTRDFSPYHKRQDPETEKQEMREQCETVATRIDIRSINANDWHLWRAVRLRALAEDPHAFSSTLASWSGEGDTETRWRDRLENVALNLVALVDDEPAGQASGCAPPADDATHLELISMWVAPEHRRSEVGRRLVEAVVRWADDRHDCGVELLVMQANTGARAFYERCGFRSVPAQAGLPPDELLMRRDRGVPASAIPDTMT
jgi:GNAT superfamily N-acetyltransferase